MSGAASAHFVSAGALSMASGVPNQIRTGFTLSGWVRPEALGGTLVYKPGEYRLLMDSGGHLQFTLWTNAGEQTLTLTEALVVGEWQSFTATYLGSGGMTLRIGGSGIAHSATPGQPVVTSAAVALGGGFTGCLDDLYLGVESQPVGVATWFNTGLTNNEVTLDSEGKATFTLTSTGLAAGAVGSGAQTVPMTVQVGSDPAEVIPNVVTVAGSQDIARLKTLVGFTAGFSLAETEEIVSQQLGKLAATGQRSTAADFPVSGPMSAQIQAGYQIGVFIEAGSGATGEAAFTIRITGSDSMDPVKSQYLRARIAQFMQEAARQGSDAAARQYAHENGGRLISELAQHYQEKMGLNQPPDPEQVYSVELGGLVSAEDLAALRGIPEVIDGQEAFEDFSVIAEVDRDLFRDLLEAAKKGVAWHNEAVRYTGAALADAFRYATAPLDDLVKWKNKAVTGLEDFIKKAVAEGLADGSFTPDRAFQIGTAWGAVRQLTDMVDVLSPEVVGQMIGQLTSVVVGAIKGDAQSQKALAEMAPLIGTWEAQSEVQSLMQQGKWFDAGQKFTEFAVSATEDAAMVYGVATVGVTTVVGTAVKIVRKALKHSRSRGLPSPRMLPDFHPHETGTRFSASGRINNGRRRRSQADSLPSETHVRFQKHLLERFGGKVDLTNPSEANAELLRAGEELGMDIVYGVFRPTADNHAIIAVRSNGTKYDYHHETMHAEHYFELPEQGRLNAWDDIPLYDREFEVLKRLHSRADIWGTLSAREKAHALTYAEHYFDRFGKATPPALTQWIQQWKLENKTLNIFEETDRYLGFDPIPGSYD